MNCDNVSCLTFWAQNVSIPLDQNMSEGAKYFITCKLYTTDKFYHQKTILSDKKVRGIYW